MTLENRVRDLAVDIATEFNMLRNEIGDLSSLSTTDKSTIVAAINEVLTNAGVQIDDVTPSSTTTFSSTQILAEITSRINDLVNGAGPALDTLGELAQALQDNDGDITQIINDFGNRVRTDVNNQGLSAAEQLNARTNIGAQSAAEIGNADRDFVADFRGALA